MIIKPIAIFGTKGANAEAEVERRSSPMAFKADDSGKVAGYGSVFGVVDSYQEIVAPGAFAESLAQIKNSDARLPMLWQHKSAEPIGGWSALSEDDYGLRVEGEIEIDAGDMEKRAYSHVKKGNVRGLSIGYYVLADSFNEKDRVRTLEKVELVEVSIVTFAANREAMLDPVKAKRARGEALSIREYEAFLREKGLFTRSEAEAIAALGYKQWLRRESGGLKANEVAEIDRMTTMLDGFSLPTI